MHIFKTTLSTLKDANKQKHKSPTLNRTVQTLLFSFVGNRPIPGITNLGSTSSTPAGVWAVRITTEMWRKGIWNDARSVELMKEAACSDVPIQPTSESKNRSLALPWEEYNSLLGETKMMKRIVKVKMKDQI